MKRLSIFLGGEGGSSSGRGCIAGGGLFNGNAGGEGNGSLDGDIDCARISSYSCDFVAEFREDRPSGVLPNLKKK